MNQPTNAAAADDTHSVTESTDAGGTERAQWSVQVSHQGPYVIRGAGATLRAATIETNDQGTSTDYSFGPIQSLQDGARLCRCGHSKNKPFCDDSHRTADVTLAETADPDPYSSDPDVTKGPQLTLRDDESLCSYARFCDAGQRVWAEVTLPGEEHATLVEHIARSCPGGRLLVSESASDAPIITTQERGLYAIEDPTLGVHGPLMLAGSVPLSSADDVPYAPRASQALCRCGNSRNKPFCDGTHASTA